MPEERIILTVLVRLEALFFGKAATHCSVHKGGRAERVDKIVLRSFGGVVRTKRFE